MWREGLFILLLVVLANSACHNYQCAPSTYDLQQGLCVKYDSTWDQNRGAYMLDLCDAQTPVCKTTDESTQVDCTAAAIVKNPGRQCSQSSECSVGCVGGLCFGRAAGQQCTKHDECAVGLACINLLCSAQLKENETCDPNDLYSYAQCENNLFCDITSKTCIKYFTLEAGAVISTSEDCNKEFVYLQCKSGACDFDSNGKGAVCAQSIYTSKEQGKLIECDPALARDTNCDGVNPSKADDTRQGLCKCAKRQYFESYCVLQPGDQKFKDTVQASVAFIDYQGTQDQSICHTFDRLNEKCWQEHDSLNFYSDRLISLKRDIRYIQNYLEVETGDACVKKNYANDWYTYDRYLECDTYQCDSSLVNKCQQFNKYDSFGLKECSSDQYCQLQDIKDPDGTCQSTTAVRQNQAPGMYCTSNSECYGSCDLSIKRCVGKAQGQTCSTNIECNVDLTCQQGTTQKQCTPQQQKGSACTLNSDCKNHLLCVDSTCQDYYSFPDGYIFDSLTCPEDFHLEACQSATCRSIEVSKKQVAQCMPAFKSDQIGKACDQNSQCKATQTYNGTVYSKQQLCQCGKGPGDENKQRRFCNIFEGDLPWQEEIRLFTMLIEIDNGICHFETKMTSACWEDNIENVAYLYYLYDYLVKKSERINYPSLKAKWDSCTQNIYFPDYYTYKNKVSQSVKFCPYFEERQLDIQCIQKVSPDDVLYYLDLCDEGKTCPVENFDYKAADKLDCITIDVKGTILPGMQASQDQDCTTSSINKATGECYGLGEDQTCDNHNKCDVGLYCNSKEKKCKYQKNQGDTCQDNYECQNDMICIGYCQYYYSLAVGTEVNLKCPTNKVMDVCATGTCEFITDTKSKCDYSYQLGGNTDDCTSNPLQCFGKQNLGEYKEIIGECRCEGGVKSRSYCISFTGDDEYQDMILSFKTIMGWDNGKCHTLARYSQDCWEQKEKDETKKYYYYKYIRNAFNSQHPDDSSLYSESYLKIFYIDYYQELSRLTPISCVNYVCAGQTESQCIHSDPNKKSTLIVQQCKEGLKNYCPPNKNIQESSECTD